MSSSITSDNTSGKDRAAKGDDNADATTKKRTASDADLSVNADHRIATRREANRMHALKSRQRSKALLQDLQNSVTVLNGEKADLERQNAILRAQVDVLSQQNRALLQSQQQMMAGGAGQMTQGMPLDMNSQQQDQLLLGSLPPQPEPHRSQPQQQQQQQPQQPLQVQAIDPQSQLNMAQQQLFAAYSGAALPNFGFLPQPFAFDANTLSLMQSLQQVQQMQQQQNQQTIMQQQPPLPVQQQAQQLPQQPMSRQESLEQESDQLGSLQSDSEGGNDDPALVTNEV